jgi:hypothetical protein
MPQRRDRGVQHAHILIDGTLIGLLDIFPGGVEQFRGKIDVCLA